ncbi:MAG: hypothetical protein HYY22_01960 [Thaumarchaeota archaeon]|nr:hypothetical protein [Nitrososphaerota archaeon]
MEQDPFSVVEYPYQRLRWEDSVIYKSEQFFRKRFKVGPMWARAPALALLSLALGNAKIRDEMGDVKPAFWQLYIAPSGTGCKTPLKNATEDIAKKWNKMMGVEHLGPDDFTPEGFTEYVTGTIGKKGGVERENVKPHPINLIIKDEFSKLIGGISNKQYQKDMLEYLSSLWDSRIGAKYTRSMQLEGGTEPYVAFLGCGSHMTYKVLTEDFFLQGLGCRFLWITEDIPQPEKLPTSFFFDSTEGDKELEELQNEILDQMKLLYSFEYIFVVSAAGALWLDYDKKIRDQIYEKRRTEGIEASVLSKIKLNALKLSAIYAGARLKYSRDQILMIDEEDMRRAIDDAEIYLSMWREAMNTWREFTINREEKRIPSSKYDLADFVRIAKANNGLFTTNIIMTELKTTYKQKVSEVIGLGIKMGLFEVAAEPGEQGTLKDEEYEKFKPKGGFSPQVFRLTKKGWET